MSFKKFLGNFVEIKEEPKPPQKKEVEDLDMDKNPIIFKKSGVAYEKPRPIITPQQANKYAQIFATFLKEENDRNHPGHDFYEFTVMKERMAMIKDESARYQATLAAVNIDKSTLLSTSDKYKAAIQREMDIFEKEYKETYDQTVGQKQKRIDQIVEEISKLQKEMDSLTVEVSKSMSEINQERELFMEAGQVAEAEIDNEVNKINQYL